VEVREGAQADAAKLPEGDALRQQLETLADEADALRKKIVATTEGGAITGEERLREHMDFVYGAIMSVEDKPTPYQVARINVLEHELKDVEDQFAELEKGELATVNSHLREKGLEQIALVDSPAGFAGGGGPARALASGLIGLRVFDVGSLQAEAGDRDERD